MHVNKKMKVLIPPKAETSGMTSLTVVKMGMAGQAMEAILGMADDIMEDVKRKAAKGEPTYLETCSGQWQKRIEA